MFVVTLKVYLIQLMKMASLQKLYNGLHRGIISFCCLTKKIYVKG